MSASRTIPDPHEREYVLGRDARVTILTSGLETAGRHDLTDTVQPPGARTPLHLHTRYDERFWVLSGSMTVWAGSETVTLHPGDYYPVPRNVPHAIESGPDGVRALQISSPAGFAELVARTGIPARIAAAESAFNEALFLAVTTELGDVILGPPGTTPADLAPGKPS